MARIRSIKPEVWMSPQVMNLSHGARLLFIGLITQADDTGRGVADPRKLRAAIFGGDDATFVDVKAWLGEVVEQRLAVLYDGGDHGPLYELPTWSSHQSIDRPKPSRYPPPSIARRLIDDESPNDREGSEGSEGSDRRERARARELDDERRKAVGDLAPGANPEAEWAAFLDNLVANDKTPADLDGAWRGWLRKVAKFGPAAAGTAGKKSSARLAEDRELGDRAARTAQLARSPKRVAADLQERLKHVTERSRT